MQHFQIYCLDSLPYLKCQLHMAVPPLWAPNVLCISISCIEFLLLFTNGISFWNFLTPHAPSVPECWEGIIQNYKRFRPEVSLLAGQCLAGTVLIQEWMVIFLYLLLMAEKTIQVIMASRGSWEVPVARTNVLNFVSNPPGSRSRSYYKFFQRLR